MPQYLKILVLCILCLAIIAGVVLLVRWAW